MKARRPKHPLAQLQHAIDAKDSNAIKTAHSKLLKMCRDENGPEIDWDNPDYSAARDYFLQQ